jgi:hypothetical protein
MNFMVLFSVTGCLLAYRQQKSPTVTDRASILASRYASGRNDAYRFLVHWPFVAEFNPPVDFREQGMIAPHSDVHARVYLGAALANDDAPGGDNLPPVTLDAETLGV